MHSSFLLGYTRIHDTHTHINNGEEFIWSAEEDGGRRCQFSKKKKKKEKNSLFVTFTRTNFTFIITKRRYVVYNNNNNNNTRALVFVRSHTPIRIRVIDSRGVSLSLSFTLAIGVIYTAYKKREQLSHREKNQHHALKSSRRRLRTRASRAPFDAQNERA